MLYKRLTLLLVSLVLLSIIVKSGVYNEWLTSIHPYERYVKEKDHMGMRERKLSRYGTSYAIAWLVDSLIKANKVVNPVILLTPNTYIRTHVPPAGYKNYISPEPSVFYYQTGLKTVLTNSPDVYKANWALLTDRNPNEFLKFLPDIAQHTLVYLVFQSNDLAVLLIDLQSRQEIDYILAHYKNYKPSL